MSKCSDCDRAQHEIANMAEEIAFWAFQAKWYYTAALNIGKNYDDLPIKQKKEVDAVFEKHRIAENRERIGDISPSYDIGS